MQRYIRHVFWALLAVALSWSTASYADKRVALVIGNGAYKSVANLPNPPKDAQAIAALLRNVGFEVVQGTDLTHAGMTETLRKFAGEAEGADVAMLFYAGHGLQLDGKNYLLPIDSSPKSEIDVKLGGPIEVDTMLEQTMGSSQGQARVPRCLPRQSIRRADFALAEDPFAHRQIRHGRNAI